MSLGISYYLYIASISSGFRVQIFNSFVGGVQEEATPWVAIGGVYVDIGGNELHLCVLWVAIGQNG